MIGSEFFNEPDDTILWPKMQAAAPAAKSLKSCPTLCDPVSCSSPGFSVYVIFQARILKGVVISFSR